MIEEQYKDRLVAIISKHLPVCSIYLYGPWAKTQGSLPMPIEVALDDREQEIDIAVLGNILEDLHESTIPYCIELADLNDEYDDVVKEVKKGFVVWKQ
ncbi:hypothetical protein K2X40_02750 [Candidatus Babeliales bacterium]|nr:hypothetical protein [Candidatus Babeliales bacterium]